MVVVGGGEFGSAVAGDLGVSAGVNQVWSLTQFYSVDFSQSRIDVKKCAFSNTQARFASAILRCPGTFAPSAAHLAVSLPPTSRCFSEVPKGESRAH